MPYFENKAPLDSNSGGSSSCENSIFGEENELSNNGRFDEAYHFMTSLDSLETVNRQMGFQDYYYSDDLQSVPFSYTNRHS